MSDENIVKSNVDLSAIQRHYWQGIGILTSNMGSIAEEIMLSSSMHRKIEKGIWYYERFILPHVQIALAKGITQEKIDEMIDQAYEKSTPDNPMGLVFKDIVSGYKE